MKVYTYIETNYVCYAYLTFVEINCFSITKSADIVRHKIVKRSVNVYRTEMHCMAGQPRTSPVSMHHCGSKETNLQDSRTP